MRKLLLTITVWCLTCASGFADTQESSVHQESGFTKMGETPDAMTFKFRDQLNLTLSKERFSSHKSAEKFCTDHGTTLDKDFSALLIVMSGATDPFLNEAITFKLEVRGTSISGIWEWSANDDAIDLMYDGRGSAVETVPASEVSQVVDIRIPAICIQKR